MSDEIIIEPHNVTFSREGMKVMVHVIGAGGIGARVVPAITKILRTGDEIHVYDGDVIEERNVFRQHFCQEDVGLYKAEVMQSRYHTERIPVVAHCEMLTGHTPLHYTLNDEREVLHYILAGVDNRAARRTILEWSRRQLHYTIYIDGGNERRSGQVLMGWTNMNAVYQGTSQVSALDITKVMPQIFEGPDTEEDGESCGLRVDTQTMNVNNMAAAIMANALSMAISGLPVSSCGWVFSTFNSIQPIPIAAHTLDPYSGLAKFVGSTKFAQR